MFHSIEGYAQYLLISSNYQKPNQYPIIFVNLYLKTALPLWVTLIITTSLPNFRTANFAGPASFKEFFLIPDTNLFDRHGNYIYHYYATSFVLNAFLLSMIAVDRYLSKKHIFLNKTLIIVVTIIIGCLNDCFQTTILYNTH